MNNYAKRFTPQQLAEMKQEDAESGTRKDWLSKKQIEAIELSRKKRKEESFSEITDNYLLDWTMSDEERLAHKAAYFHKHKKIDAEKIAKTFTLIEIDRVIKKIQYKENRQKDIKDKNKYKLLYDFLKQNKKDKNALQIARNKRYREIANDKEKIDFNTRQVKPLQRFFESTWENIKENHWYLIIIGIISWIYLATKLIKFFRYL